MKPKITIGKFLTRISSPYLMPFDLEAEERRTERRTAEPARIPPGSTLPPEQAGMIEALLEIGGSRARNAALREREANPRPPADLED